MIGFAVTLGATLASFLIPSFLGLLLISAAARVVSVRYLAAFCLGLYFWFFSDTIGDASLLGVNEGFTGGIWHILLWLVFAIGLIIVLAIDSNLFTSGSAGTSLGFAIPVLLAFAVGVHGIGEGGTLAATAATTPSTNLVDAFGGLSAAVAFLLHKALEPMMIGAAYWVYARGHAKDTTRRVIDLLILTLAFSVPGIIGGGVSYYLVQVFPNLDFTYVFALGLGTSLYAAFRLARPLFEGARADSARIALCVVLGFTSLYIAALLHS